MQSFAHLAAATLAEAEAAADAQFADFGVVVNEVLAVDGDRATVTGWNRVAGPLLARALSYATLTHLQCEEFGSLLAHRHPE